MGLWKVTLVFDILIFPSLTLKNTSLSSPVTPVPHLAPEQLDVILQHIRTFILLLKTNIESKDRRSIDMLRTFVHAENVFDGY